MDIGRVKVNMEAELASEAEAEEQTNLEELENGYVRDKSYIPLNKLCFCGCESEQIQCVFCGFISGKQHFNEHVCQKHPNTAYRVASPRTINLLNDLPTQDRILFRTVHVDAQDIFTGRVVKSGNGAVINFRKQYIGKSVLIIIRD